MTVDELIQALGLPDTTRVNQRVPKKLLTEHGAVTAADRRQIQDGVDEITWLASLKPHVIGVPAFEDNERHYIELAVLSMLLKVGAKPGRLVELLHRAVPYPMLLATSVGNEVSLSLVHLRTSQIEADKTVLDGAVLAVALPADGGSDEFRAALSLARQPQGSLFVLYQGWMDTVGAQDIAQETGRFQPSLTREQAAARHSALQQCRQLRTKVAQLRAQAGTERQLARQIALNQEIKQLCADIEAAQRTMDAGSLN